MITFGKHDKATLEQAQGVANEAEHFALMADGHLGYWMPVGGVAAFDQRIPITGVGFDIGCGNLACKLALYESDLEEGDWARIGDAIWKELSFGTGRTNGRKDAPTDHPLLDSYLWMNYPLAVREELRAIARSQLGTIGSGNHYVDLFVDEEGYVWVGLHFGSRGLGYRTANGFINLLHGKDWNARADDSGPCFVSMDTWLGQCYFDAMTLCGAYAKVGRTWVVGVIREVLGWVQVLESIHNHHNYAWYEEHFGRGLWVVRKGATPAFPGQKGFVGGSMADEAYIIEGAEASDLAQGALYSTVHGAGRVMSRSKARKGIGPQDMADALETARVVLRGGDLDEAPQAYRKLSRVIQAQKNTIKVLHTLTPKVVLMAGPTTFDPYKD